MLHELIRNARRRLLFNEILKQFALSAALAIGGLALLLTLGTRYLEWWVVALFALAVTAWAFVKLRKKLPGDYAAAVWLDDKACLHDSLSTAHYFAKKPRAGALSPETEAMLLAQRGQAEAAAGGVNVSLAVPFRFPKALYGLAALLFVSTGLVTVRYFYGHDLNLSAPITEVIFPDLAAIQSHKAAKSAHNPKKPEDYDEAARSLLAKLGLGTDLDVSQDEKLDQALADALKSGEKTSADGDAKSDPKTDNGDPLSNPPETPKSNNNSPAGDNADRKSGSNGNPLGQNNAASGERAAKSLLAKLKDAMDNMMGSATAQGDKNSDGKPQQSKSSDKAQSGQPNGNPNNQDNKAAAEGQANGAAQTSNSPGQTGANQSSKQQGPSAAGAEDGEKAIKAAAQIKAMGKISELIGKRSEEVTGESMIDVQSGNQKLQTAYKDEAATHGEGTGDVSRDEIPLSEQAYVQEYFEQVHKPEGTTAAPAAKKPAAAPAPGK